MPAISGIKFRAEFTIPRTDLNSLIILGVGKLTSFYAILTDPNSICGQYVSQVFYFLVSILLFRLFPSEAGRL